MLFPDGSMYFHNEFIHGTTDWVQVVLRFPVPNRTQVAHNFYSFFVNICTLVAARASI